MSLPNNFSNIGRDEVTDELFGVIVNGSSLLHCCHDGRKVVICQYHFYEMEEKEMVSHCQKLRNCYLVLVSSWHRQEFHTSIQMH